MLEYAPPKPCSNCSAPVRRVLRIQNLSHLGCKAWDLGFRDFGVQGSGTLGFMAWGLEAVFGIRGSLDAPTSWK